MKIGLIGSVGSSYATLVKLIEFNFDIVSVWGFEPESIKNISCYSSMKSLAENNGIQYYSFRKVNDLTTKQQIIDKELDLLFVVGLSQMVDEEILAIPKYGCIGFHPTKLPNGRGRAPIAWLINDVNDGAATFFKLEKEADSGIIYAQEDYKVFAVDDVESISVKVISAINIALGRWLPELKNGVLKGWSQDDSLATYNSKRDPIDGCINWYNDAELIDRLIKSSTFPFPGAFSFYKDYKILILKSIFHKTGFPRGVVGRIVAMSQFDYPVIQTGNGYIEVKKYLVLDYFDNIIDLKLSVGILLGFYEQYEIFLLRNELKKIKERLNEKHISNSSTS